MTASTTRQGLQEYFYPTVARRLAAIYAHTGGYGGVLILAYDWEGENRDQWQHSCGCSPSR